MYLNFSYKKTLNLRIHIYYRSKKEQEASIIPHKKTARRFVSLNILLSHPRSLKVIRNNTVE